MTSILDKTSLPHQDCSSKFKGDSTISYSHPEQQKYVCKLLGYDFTIDYRPRKLNAVVDALSRVCGIAREEFRYP